MSWIAGALCLLIALVGATGVVSPDTLLAFARSFLTTPMVYVGAAFRIAVGIALVLAAPASRIPTLIRPIGVVILVAGLVTPFVGVDRVREVVEWASGLDPGFLRLWAAFPLAVGSFLTWAVLPVGRRTGDDR